LKAVLVDNTLLSNPHLDMQRNWPHHISDVTFSWTDFF